MTDHCLEESRGLSGGTPQGLPACPPPSAECLERSRGGLSLNHLKAVAVAAMVIDHIAFAFVPDGTLLAILLHSIGKITGPTMFFAAVEGCHHTRNLNRYLLRLAVFALVSWFPFLYFHFGGDLAAIQLMRPNVIYTIFLGVLAVRIRRSPRLCSAWKVLLILLLFILSVPADWGYTGVVIILVFDYYYGSWKHQAFAYCMVVMLDMGVLSLLIHPFFGLFTTMSSRSTGSSTPTPSSTWGRFCRCCSSPATQAGTEPAAVFPSGSFICSTPSTCWSWAGSGPCCKSRPSRPAGAWTGGR